MRVSIITVAYNNHKTIEETILSVASQNHHDIEYVIVDGKSNDGTQIIIEKYRRYIKQFISESDKGIYDAMNKGIRLTSGELIGFLNADDLYAYDSVVSDVVGCVEKNKVDAVYGDLVYVDADKINRVLRYYDSSIFKPREVTRGIMPAHPTLFLKRAIFDRFGLFNPDYHIAGDFEYVARIFSSGIRYHYMPKVLVKMRQGGISTRSLISNWKLNREMYRACLENGIATNYLKIYSKYPVKLLGLIFKNRYKPTLQI